jgi:hypothetical protein
MEADTVSDPIADALAEAADSALELAEGVIHAHEMKDAIQDSLIAIQTRRIGFLESALSSKDDEVSALNRRIAVDVKRIRNTKKQWLLIGIAADEFVRLALYAGKQ